MPGFEQGGVEQGLQQRLMCSLPSRLPLIYETCGTALGRSPCKQKRSQSRAHGTIRTGAKSPHAKSSGISCSCAFHSCAGENWARGIDRSGRFFRQHDQRRCRVKLAAIQWRREALMVRWEALGRRRREAPGSAPPCAIPAPQSSEARSRRGLSGRRRDEAQAGLCGRVGASSR